MEMMEVKGNEDQLDQRVNQVPQEVKVRQGHQEPWVSKVLQGPRDQLGTLVMRELLVLPVMRAQQDSVAARGPKEAQVLMEFLGKEEELVNLALTE